VPSVWAPAPGDTEAHLRPLQSGWHSHREGGTGLDGHSPSAEFETVGRPFGAVVPARARAPRSSADRTRARYASPPVSSDRCRGLADDEASGEAAIEGRRSWERNSRRRGEPASGAAISNVWRSCSYRGALRGLIHGLPIGRQMAPPRQSVGESALSGWAPAPGDAAAHPRRLQSLWRERERPPARLDGDRRTWPPACARSFAVQSPPAHLNSATGRNSPRIAPAIDA
jgi:hypothetical protein